MRTKLLAILNFTFVIHAYAGSATWKENPIDNNWNNAANWTPETVPNGPDDIATFGASNQNAVSISADIEVGQIVFDAGVGNFTITTSPEVGLILRGLGVTNNSGRIQTLILATPGGTMSFENSATAGDQMSYILNEAQGLYGGAALDFYDTSSAGTASFVTRSAGVIQFHDNATAGAGSFINDYGKVNGQTIFFDNSNAGTATFRNKATPILDRGGGETIFWDVASAGAATFINEGGPFISGGLSGATYFFGHSNGGDALILLHGGTAFSGEPGRADFAEDSSAGHATFRTYKGAPQALGGLIEFFDRSEGGTSRMELQAKSGWLDLSFHPGETKVGLIEGNGFVFIAYDGIAIGSNNLDTTFSGTIDGQAGWVTKDGTGVLNLTGASSYTGTNNPVAGTIVLGGTLLVNNTTGSATGTGSVLVRGGTLGGNGAIAGSVQIGDDDGTEASLLVAHSNSRRATLTIRAGLTFVSDAIFRVRMNSDAGHAGAVVANGATIEGGQFSMSDIGNTLLPLGTVLEVIDNTALTPILGTFSNLADGGTIVVGSNSFQANYEGGDGNDLTLTVVP